MPGFGSAISNNTAASFILALDVKQVQGIGIFDTISDRDDLPGGAGGVTPRINGYIAIVKDADGNGTTKAYIYTGGDSGNKISGEYVADADWDAEYGNWSELSTFTELSQDTTPQLGGDLDVNGNKITSTSNGNIELDPNGNGNVVLGNFTFNANQSVGAGQDNYVLTYNQGTGLISLEAGGGGSLSSEEVEDIVGAMFDGGTETRISATYDDTNGKINLVVNDMTANDNTQNSYAISVVDGGDDTEEKIRLTQSGHDGANTDDIVLKVGAGLSISRNGDVITLVNDVSDTNTVDMGDGFKIRDTSGNDQTVIENQFVKFETATGALGTSVTGTGTTNDPYVIRLTSPDTDNNTTYTPGDGLDLNGTTFSTDLKANSGLVIDSGEVSIDVNDVTAAVAEGADTVPDLIREGITGGIEMIGHINSSQGTVKFTFDQFIEAIVSGMINSEVTSGFGSVDTYTGAGSSTPYDLDGNGLIGVSDLLLFLSNYGTAASTTIPRTVLFEYKDDVDDANTNGSLGTVGGSTGAIAKVNQVIGVITDTDHFEVNTVGTGEKSVDVTIDNTNGSTTEDMVVFKDQTGGATGDVLISAIGAQSTNGSIKASLGGWTFINTGVGSFSFYLSMKVGRKVGSSYTFSNPVQITQILGTSDFFGIDVALDLSETVVEMNELVLPTVSADDGTVDVKKVFDAGTPNNVDFIAPNTTEVAIQLMYTMIGSGQEQIQQTGRGDVTYTCSVF